MNKHLPILLLLCLCSLLSAAQNLNGFWKGTLSMSGGCFPVNHIELQITIDGTAVYGNSYHYLDVNNYVKKKFRGSYNASEKKLVLNEGEVTTFKIPATCQVCIKNYTLVYARNGDVETLSGGWDGHIMNSIAECSPGSIVLTRIKESAFKEIPEITVDTGEIRLDFYDNGEIDGDSITVLVNKQLVLSHQKLTAKPVTTFIRVDLHNKFQEIEMVAENLGSIPPNTALLIITAGKKRYRLALTSTEAKSAMVRFVYDSDVGNKL